MVQKLIMQQAVDQKGARYITDTLWMLMESGTEEVKVLQSVTLLLTTNTIVHGDTLARVCIISSRLLSKLYFSVQEVDETRALSCIRRVQHSLLQFIHQYLRFGVNNLAYLFSAKRPGSAHVVVVLTTTCGDCEHSKLCSSGVKTMA